MQSIPRIILRAEARKALGGISKSTQYRLEASPDFPAVIELSPRLRGYDATAFAEYLRSRRTRQIDGRATAAATDALARKRRDKREQLTAADDLHAALEQRK